MSLDKLIARDRQARRSHRPLPPSTSRRRRFLPTWRWTSPSSSRGGTGDALLKTGQAGTDRPAADRHRSVRAGAVPGAIPPSAIERFNDHLGSEAEARCAGVLDQQGPGGAAREAARQRVPGDGRVPNLADLPADQGGPRRLRYRNKPGLNVGYLAFNNQKAPFHRQRVAIAITWRSTSRRSWTRCTRAPAPAGEEPQSRRPCGPTITTIHDFPPRSGAGKEAAGRGRIAGRVRADLWAMPVQRPYNPDARAHRRTDAGRPGQGRHQGAHRQLRMGQVRKRAPEASTRWPKLGWTGDNGDPDNFFVPLASCAASRPGGGGISKWCNQTVRRPG